MSYPKTESKANFLDLELSVLEYWNKNNTFYKLRNKNINGEPFILFDGPATPSSIPHLGHVGVSAVKDMVCRYNYMRGKNVIHKLGWDVHGLPTEVMVEKATNKQSKDLVKELGISKFCEMCKEGVMKYVKDWEIYLKRIGRWVEIDNVYNTMNIEYMESVIWAIKNLYDQGLIYKDFKVNPFDWALGTVISNSEASSEYQDIFDDAITVSFDLDENTKILAWTTTPWTLPANSALAINSNMNYLVMQDENKINYIIAESCLKRYEKQFQNTTKIQTISGKELIGKEYKPLFNYYNNNKLYKIIDADYVSDKTGTGIVHIAPAFGEDDYINIKKKDPNFPVLVNVDEYGNFTNEVKDWANMNIFEASPKIIEYLKNKGHLIKKEQYKHSYPFSPRSKQKLIYRATEAWYIDVPKILDKLLKNNSKVNWKSAGNRFLSWIENARPWGISRNRFWGVPLPIWTNKKGEIKVFGSIKEMEDFFDVKIDNLHRPILDELKKDDWERIPDVLDAWFESGSMPFAYKHYPFENKELIEDKNYMSDYIVEGQDQTRGWFYTLMVLSSALFDRPAFKVISANGHIVDEHKKKLSKSLKNYSDPFELIEKYGADSIRVYMLGSNFLKAEPIAIDKEGTVFKESIKNILTPIWNAYHFFTLYANASNIHINEKTEINLDNVLDKYIISELTNLNKIYFEYMDNYKIDFVIKEFIKFLDILNNWYIRRTRERFWKEDINAFNVLYFVISEFCKMLAPFAPFITEYIYLNLHSKSIHLENISKLKYDIDAELINDMRYLQSIISTGKQLREQYKLPNRQPLSKMIIAGKELDKYSDIIKDELNIKNIIFTKDISQYATESIYLITPKIGTRLGSALKEIIQNIKQGLFEIKGNKLYTKEYVLNSDEFEKRLNIKEGLTGLSLQDNTSIIIIDIKLNQDLIYEGLANEVRRFIQDTRKNMNLDISDRILLTFNSDKVLYEAIMIHKEKIMNDALIIQIKEGKGEFNTTIDNYKIEISIEKC